MIKQIRGLAQQMRTKWNRHVSVGDLLTDRWQTAHDYGWGAGTSCYDNVLVLGDVKVGCNTWIGPGCVLDGSGGLEIGDYCSISAGSQIYSHDTVAWATSMGEEPYQRSPTRIGSGVFIGPNAVIARGVTIGDRAIIGALTFVNHDVAAGAKVLGRQYR